MCELDRDHSTCCVFNDFVLQGWSKSRLGRAAGAEVCCDRDQAKSASRGGWELLGFVATGKSRSCRNQNLQHPTTQLINA